MSSVPETSHVPPTTALGVGPPPPEPTRCKWFTWHDPGEPQWVGERLRRTPLGDSWPALDQKALRAPGTAAWETQAGLLGVCDS